MSIPLALVKTEWQLALSIDLYDAPDANLACWRQVHHFVAPVARETPHYWQATDLYRLRIGPVETTGNWELIRWRIKQSLRQNPAGLSSDSLAVVEAFLKEQEAKDGVPSLSEAHPGDPGW
jgi:hypothetical protein